jgi:hypothetical protein
MPGYQWIEHKNKRILYMDIASQTTEELTDIIERIKLVIVREPLESVLCQYERHTKMIALLGVEGLQKVLYNGVLMFTRSKKILLKNSRKEALDWLAEQ